MKKIIAIAGFGFVGALLRVSLTELAGQQHAIMTILINVIGSFLLVVVTSILPLLLPLDDVILTGLSVGFVGTFTTFSTFCVDSATLQHPLAVIYWLTSLILGYLAAWCGLRWADWLRERRRSGWQ